MKAHKSYLSIRIWASLLTLLIIAVAVVRSAATPIPRAQAQVTNEIYFDDFSTHPIGSTPAGWTEYGTQAISTEIVAYGGNGSNYHRLEFPAYVAEQTRKWLIKDGLTVGEATTTVKLNFQTSSDGGGLVVAWQDSDNLIAVMPNPFWDEITVWEITDGEVSRAWNSGGRYTVSIENNQDYWLRVMTQVDPIEGNQLFVYWSTDGVNFTERVAINNVSRIEGQVGVGTYQFLSHTLFDDFHVEYSDIVAPAAITDLTATSGDWAGQVQLSWTAPGDDAQNGIASNYTVRYSHTAIESEFGWLMASDVNGEPAPGPAGSAESMTVTGLTPGETYYFAIRAEDDVSNLSGLSNSPGAVAGEAPDLGFRPDVDGFQFANRQIQRSWDMFEQYFGTENVHHPNGERCLAAERYFTEEYRAAADGWSCLGFAQASLLSYMSFSQPNAGRFGIPHYDQLYGQPLSQALTSPIAYYSGVQSSRQWATEYYAWLAHCDSSSTAMVDTIRYALENGQPVVLSLNTGLGILHTISPYLIEDVSPTESRISIYDSEAPGEERLLVLRNNGNSWQWEYTFIGSVGAAGSRTGACKDMYLLSVSTALERGIPPVNFCQPPGNELHTTTTSTILTSVPTSENWVIWSDQGQRFGWVDGAFVAEIPDTFIVPQTLGEATTESQTVILPNAAYMFESEAGVSGATEQTLFADGRFLHFSGDTNSPASTIQVTTTMGLEGFVLNNLSQFNSISVSADSEQSDGSRLGVITVSATGESENVFVHFDGQQLQLKPTGGQIRYNLELQHSSGQRFIHYELELLSTDTHLLTPVDWAALDNSVVHLEIDRGSDGTVDETVILEDQDDSLTLSIYLPVMMGP